MANSVDDIASKLAKLYEPETADPEPEPEPESEPPGKGNVVPTAGHSPGELTPEQMQALAAQAGGPETTDQKTQRLNAMLQDQHIAHRWYGK